MSHSTNARHIKVGVGQIEAATFDLHANLGKHIEMIREARDRGVEMLLFPELSLTGYMIGPAAIDLAMPRHDPFLLQLAAHAKGMTVVAGFVEEAPAAQFYNSSVAMRDGAVLFVHRKLNLATYGNLEEDKYFAEGRYIDVFSHRSPWTAGILICADVWNPGLVHLAALHGCTMLLAPVASSVEAVFGDFSNPRGWELALSFYAMMYGMPVLMANHWGRFDDLNFFGQSRIVDPHGNTLAVADDKECLITAELDYHIVRRARFQLPTVRDSNLDLIHREIERMANRIGVPWSVLEKR
ncbi:MAG: nitrilase-related carbon-nitrogen hydrolase [Pseudomonadota bacterium]